MNEAEEGSTNPQIREQETSSKGITLQEKWNSLEQRESRLTHRSRASIAKRLSIPAKQVGKKTHFREHETPVWSLPLGNLKAALWLAGVQSSDHIQPSSADESTNFP